MTLGQSVYPDIALNISNYYISNVYTLYSRFLSLAVICIGSTVYSTNWNILVRTNYWTLPNWG